MRKIIFFVLLFLISFHSSGQELSISPWMGYGTWSMNDLKTIQSQALTLYDINIKSLEKFPPYYFYGLDIIQTTKRKIGYGLTGSYYTTGARNHYQDYSGLVRQDFLTSSLNIGGLLSYQLDLNTRLKIDFEIRSGVKFSKLNIDEEFKIWDNSTVENGDFNSRNFWFNPQLAIEMKVFSFLFFKTFIGYEMNDREKTSKKDDNKVVLKKMDGSNASIDWTGFRLGAGFSFKIPEKH